MSTKVSIDANGLLKVTHVISLAAADGGSLHGSHAPSSSGAAAPSASQALWETQRLDSGRTATVQFVMSPVDAMV
jgi:hypothetical protein